MQPCTVWECGGNWRIGDMCGKTVVRCGGWHCFSDVVWIMWENKLPFAFVAHLTNALPTYSLYIALLNPNTVSIETTDEELGKARKHEVKVSQMLGAALYKGKDGFHLFYMSDKNHSQQGTRMFKTISFEPKTTKPTKAQSQPSSLHALISELGRLRRISNVGRADHSTHQLAQKYSWEEENPRPR